MVSEAVWNAWTPAQLAPYLDVALQCFGARRCMIGSDWPVCCLAGFYERVVAVVRDYVSRLSIDEQDAVMGVAASTFYRLV